MQSKPYCLRGHRWQDDGGGADLDFTRRQPGIPIGRKLGGYQGMQVNASVLRPDASEPTPRARLAERT